MSQPIQPDKCITRTFYISTEKRDKGLHPHPSKFVYPLPLPLKNVVGVAIDHFKFPKEQLVNENNKRMEITIDAGVVASEQTNEVNGVVLISKGDYGLIPLLTEMNRKLQLYGIGFSLNQNQERVVLTFTDDFVQYYIAIAPNTLLKALGYESGICLCRPGFTNPPSPAFPCRIYDTAAVAEKEYDVSTISDMVMRITDVETILSNDSITNRATMILYSSMDPTFATNGGHGNKTILPLLQTQHRLQSLRIELLNTLGQLYDTIGSEATFVVQFYCLPE